MHCRRLLKSQVVTGPLIFCGGEMLFHLVTLHSIWRSTDSALLLEYCESELLQLLYVFSYNGSNKTLCATSKKGSIAQSDLSDQYCRAIDTFFLWAGLAAILVTTSVTKEDPQSPEPSQQAATKIVYPILEKARQYVTSQGALHHTSVISGSTFETDVSPPTRLYHAMQCQMLPSFWSFCLIVAACPFLPCLPHVKRCGAARQTCAVGRVWQLNLQGYISGWGPQPLDCGRCLTHSSVDSLPNRAPCRGVQRSHWLPHWPNIFRWLQTPVCRRTLSRSHLALPIASHTRNLFVALSKTYCELSAPDNPADGDPHSGVLVLLRRCLVALGEDLSMGRAYNVAFIAGMTTTRQVWSHCTHWGRHPACHLYCLGPFAMQFLWRQHGQAKLQPTSHCSVLSNCISWWRSVKLRLFQMSD